VATAERAADLAQQAMTKANYAENALIAIYASSSWRMTAPVRWIGNQRRLLRERGVVGRTRDLLKKCCRPLLALAIGFFDARPDLRARHSGVAGKAKLYDRLRSAYLRISSDEDFATTMPTTDSPYAPTLTSTMPTPQAQQIHHELKSAIEKNRKES
jgi:hypothetical protein